MKDNWKTLPLWVTVPCQPACGYGISFICVIWTILCYFNILAQPFLLVSIPGAFAFFVLGCLQWWIRWIIKKSDENSEKYWFNYIVSVYSHEINKHDKIMRKLFLEQITIPGRGNDFPSCDNPVFADFIRKWGGLGYEIRIGTELIK